MVQVTHFFFCFCFFFSNPKCGTLDGYFAKIFFRFVIRRAKITLLSAAIFDFVKFHFW